MGQIRHDAHQKSVRIEPWEIEVAKSVARSFRSFPEYEDLEAELLKRLLELKVAKPAQVRDWRGFLARSLYNAATNLVNRRNWWRRRALSLDARVGDDEESPTVESLLAAPEESAELGFDLAAVWRDISPDLKELWEMLVEEEGNVAAVARRLGRPPRTVRDWAARLRSLLEARGLDEPRS